MVLRMGNFRKGYRSRLEIVRDILLVVEEADNPGSKKTHVMYGANLSHKLITQYLEDILEAGLIKYDGETYYVITEKGEVFLRLYEDYEENCREIERRIVRQKNGEERLEEMLTSH